MVHNTFRERSEVLARAGKGESALESELEFEDLPSVSAPFV